MKKSSIMFASLACYGAGGVMHGGELHLIAASGQAVPDGNGVYSGGVGVDDFPAPALNHRGVVTFYAGVSGATGNSSHGVFCGTPGLVAQVARTKQQLAVLGGGQLGSMSDESGAINDAGQVAFLSGVPPVGGFGAHAIFRKGPTPDGFQMVARSYDPAPGEGSFRLGTNAQFRPVLGSSGHVAFYSELSGTDGGTTDNAGIFRGSPLGDSVVRIVQKGDTVPGGIEPMKGLNAIPAVNSSGQVAAFALLARLDMFEAIVRGNGSNLAAVARKGDVVPGGGTIAHFPGKGLMMNNDGDVAFSFSTDGGSGAEGIAKGSEPGGLQAVAVLGQPILGTGREFNASIPIHVCLNNAGQVGFVAGSVTDAGQDFRRGLFRDQTLVALDSEIVPGGGATFRSFSNASFALNNSGQMAFKAWLDITGNGTGYGIYFWDENSGLHEIARYGGSLLGSTITGIEFAGTSGTEVLPAGMNGLNDAGEVAFEFTLADGREGIALWSSLPKPGGGSGSIERIAGGFRVRFPGIPGWSYQVERDENLLPPWEVVPDPIQADPDGWVRFDDLGPGLPGRRFYRCFEAP